ncbi:hypothetical protein CABS03_13665, partial [Colletotrichum abscissum]
SPSSDILQVQRNINLTQPNFNLHQQHIDFESNPNQQNPHHTFSNPNPTNQNHLQPTKFAITSRQHGLLKPLPGRQHRFPKPTEAIVVLQERLETGDTFSQAFAALRAMPQVKRCGYYPEKSAATAAPPAAKTAHVSSPTSSRVIAKMWR